MMWDPQAPTCSPVPAGPVAPKTPSLPTAPNPHARHSYVPAAPPKLKTGLLAAKDQLPVLRRTGSSTPVSRWAAPFALLPSKACVSHQPAIRWGLCAACMR